MNDRLAKYPAAVLDTATRAIEAAKAAGDISNHGFGEHVGGGKYRTDLPVSNPRFDRSEVATVLLFLAGGPVRVLPKVTRACSSSYQWKHEAEHWGRRMGFEPYVSNGAFIVAAEWLGIPSHRYINVPNIFYALKPLRDDLQSGCFAFGDPAWEQQRAAQVSQARARRTITRY